MPTGKSLVRGLAEGLGTTTFMAWFLVLGPVGFVLLLGIVYAIEVQNLACGIVCGLLLFTPAVLLVVWGTVVSVGLLRARFERPLAAAGETAMERTTDE